MGKNGLSGMMSFFCIELNKIEKREKKSSQKVSVYPQGSSKEEGIILGVVSAPLMCLLYGAVDYKATRFCLGFRVGIYHLKVTSFWSAWKQAIEN